MSTPVSMISKHHCNVNNILSRMYSSGKTHNVTMSKISEFGKSVRHRVFPWCQIGHDILCFIDQQSLVSRSFLYSAKTLTYFKDGDRETAFVYLLVKILLNCAPNT